MNVRLPLVLLGLVLVPLAALLVMALSGESFDPADRLLQLDGPDSEAIAKAVDAVELVRTEPTEQKLVLARVGPDKWEASDPPGAAIDGFAITSLVRDLVRVKPTPFAELTGNLTTHGLDKPTLKITLRQGSGKSATLNIGQTTIGKGNAVTFVSTAARPDTPLAVKRSDLEAVFKPGSGEGAAWQVARWLPDFRQRRVIGADLRDPVSDLASLKVSHAGKEMVVKRTDAGDWLFTAPANFGQADVAGSPDVEANTFTGVRPLLTALTGLQVTDPNDFIETPGSLDQYGLNPGNPSIVRIELTPKVGKPDVLIVGHNTDNNVDNKVVPTKVYAMREGDRAVMRLTTDRLPALTTLATDPTDLRDRTLVSDQKRESIDAIDVTVGGVTTKIRKVSVGAAEQWVLYGGPTDPQIAGAAVGPLISQLTLPRVAKEVLTGPYDAAFAPNERKTEVKLWFDAIEPGQEPAEAGKLPAEPQLKGEAAVTLLFGQATADTAFVRRSIPGGPAVDLKVPTSVLAAANRGRLEFLNLQLKSFPTNTANRLSFTRGSESFELTKEAAPDSDYQTGKWVYAKPDRLKGQIADAAAVNNELLTKLTTQVALRVVAETPSTEELAKFGLEPARQTVTVGTTVTPNEITYQYGIETEDRQAVYVREAGRPLVFTVPAGVAATFATADLRDRVLYRLDRATVNRIRLRGWKQQLQQPGEVVLEKGPSGWEVKQSPEPLTADPTKVEMLLAQLTAPRAESFLGKDLRPEYGFDVAKDANALEVQISDAKQTVDLTIGAEANNGLSFYVWCSVPNEVVTLPAAVLRVFKEKPTGLQK